MSANDQDRASNSDKIAPNVPEFEEAVLGSCLPDLAGQFKLIAGNKSSILSARDFFILKNQWVFEAMKALLDRGDPIDNLTVIDELRKTPADRDGENSRLDMIGGSAYITYLINSCPDSNNGLHYAKIVRVAAIRRRLLAAAGDIAQVALEQNAPISEVLAQAKSIIDVVLSESVDDPFVHIGDTAEVLYENAMDRYKTGIATINYSTGLPGFDDALEGGFRPHDLITVAADSGNGKTSLALQFAMVIAKRDPDVLENNHPVLYFSKEMTDQQLTARIMSMDSGIGARTVLDGVIDDKQVAGLTDTFGKVYGLNLWTECRAKVRSDIEVSARNFASRFDRPIGLIVIDYVQRYRPDRLELSKDSERLLIADMSWAAKSLALELHCPVLMLTQVNKLEEGKDIELDNLFGSQAIKHDSDMVIALNWPKARKAAKIHVRPTILKNRNGASGFGIPNIFYINNCTCFIEEAPIEQKPLYLPDEEKEPF